MNESIGTLQPTAIWRNFAKLLAIPRPSKHEGRIIAFMKEFGENLGLETIVDEVGNVIIRKPATPGMEGRKGVILQGHLDMVPQKNSDVSHDFENDPIDAWVDGEWVKARGTTLGSDNGMGVAAAMAILEATDIPHGPVEALFTIDEETGMTGAFHLKPGVLKGDILMNLDSEDEGELYIGCAGGMNGSMTFTYKEEAVPDGHTAFRLSIAGMRGGHSGMDIVLGRGNAIKSITRFLWENEDALGLRIAAIDGGGLRNAIPREAYVDLTLPFSKTEELKSNFNAFSSVIKSELSTTEPDLSTKLEAIEMPVSIIDKSTQKNMLRAVYACPNGVIRMSADMEGLVETSTNLAILKSEAGKIRVMCLLRSSVDSAKHDLAHMMESVFMLAGAECVFDGEYPGWKPNPDSPILAHMRVVYNERFGKIPEVKAIHAGLECGILGANYPNWDMISFGPTIRFPHSPDEKVNIPSVQKFWDFVMETLTQIPSKPVA